MEKTDEKLPLKKWMSLVGLTCASFVFNTSEFVPIGLLTDIATDFRITEAHAGMIISVYAWVVMILSMPLMMLVSKMELRKLLLCTFAVFIVFQVMSYLSTGYAMLMLSRIGVACAHSVFWSIISIIAVSIVPERFRALALSMIVTGTSVAIIFGLPLGRIIGLQIGWRMTFFSIGAFAFLTLIYLVVSLPKVPSQGGFSLRQLPGLLKNKLLIGLYVLSLAIATSYYTGYSYIEPFLMQVVGMADDWITTTLMIFGAAGILGSIAFSKYYSKNRYTFMSVVLLGVSACLLLMQLMSFSMYAMILLCALWGMMVTAFNVSMQSEIISDSPGGSTAVSMAIFSGIFNLGIGCGTFVGGVVCTHFSISYIGYAGGALALLTFLFWSKNVKQYLRCRYEKL